MRPPERARKVLFECETCGAVVPVIAGRRISPLSAVVPVRVRKRQPCHASCGGRLQVVGRVPEGVT